MKVKEALGIHFLIYKYRCHGACSQDLGKGQHQHAWEGIGQALKLMGQVGRGPWPRHALPP